jgi:hypothetical protein
MDQRSESLVVGDVLLSQSHKDLPGIRKAQTLKIRVILTTEGGDCRRTEKNCTVDLCGEMYSKEWHPQIGHRIDQAIDS